MRRFIESVGAGLPDLDALNEPLEPSWTQELLQVGAKECRRYQGPGGEEVVVWLEQGKATLVHWACPFLRPPIGVCSSRDGQIWVEPIGEPPVGFPAPAGGEWSSGGKVRAAVPPCPSCAEPVASADARFCPHCGYELQGHTRPAGRSRWKQITGAALMALAVALAMFALRYNGKDTETVSAQVSPSVPSPSPLATTSPAAIAQPTEAVPQITASPPQLPPGLERLGPVARDFLPNGALKRVFYANYPDGTSGELELWSTLEDGEMLEVERVDGQTTLVQHFRVSGQGVLQDDALCFPTTS